MLLLTLNPLVQSGCLNTLSHAPASTIVTFYQTLGGTIYRAISSLFLSTWAEKLYFGIMSLYTIQTFYNFRPPCICQILGFKLHAEYTKKTYNV